jgi:hypothetical protein
MSIAFQSFWEAICTLPDSDKKGNNGFSNQRASQKHAATKQSDFHPATCPGDDYTDNSFASFIHLDKHMKGQQFMYDMSLGDSDMVA